MTYFDGAKLKIKIWSECNVKQYMLSNILMAQNETWIIKFWGQKRRTEMENVRYNLWAGEIISSISYLNNLQNICFDFHFNEAEMIYFKYPFNLHFEGVFIFNSVCIERYRLLIARSLPTHRPLHRVSITHSWTRRWILARSGDTILACISGRGEGNICNKQKITYWFSGRVESKHGRANMLLWHKKL